MRSFYYTLRKPCTTCGAEALDECVGLDASSDNPVRRFHPARRNKSRPRYPRYKDVLKMILEPPLFPPRK